MAGISLFEVMRRIWSGLFQFSYGRRSVYGIAGKKAVSRQNSRESGTVVRLLCQNLSGTWHRRALLGGIMGFETDDLRIRDSLTLAKEEGISYRFSTAEKEPGRYTP